MNIFFLSEDPKECAKFHNNKHVVKMILETAQLLCGVHHMTEGGQYDIPYKLSHKNHPCSLWTRKSLSNYLWLCELGLELCQEYTYRYGKTHKSKQVIEWCLDKKPNIDDIGFIDPPKAMPDEYKVNSVIESYRNYYLGAKSSFCNWKNRETPDWFSLNVKIC
jgi:hypothetical protein